MDEVTVHSTVAQQPSQIRFQIIDDLKQYLENIGDRELDFRAIPISGMPETFHYDGHKKVVIRQKDQRMFDNIEDFLCYAFQCDSTGYPNTEYVDVVTLE